MSNPVARLFVVLACAVVALGSMSRVALAEESGPATFAVIIGSNVSVDRDLAALKYADDDAARYLDLFRLLGARTYLLSRLDDNTRRLHPQAAAEAAEPRQAAFEKTMAQVGVDVAQARERHLATVVYFVFAGHGGVENGVGYITLEDMRLTGGDLARYLGAIPAAQIHVIADACASYFLAYSRGPGGERRPLHGFQDAPQLANDPRIGLLLSTSSEKESHEWDAFQAGVFSHEVRSGLYGAADADGDGKVSYREIAAFVARANESIPNERFRPDVHVKPPSQSETLLDLRRGLGRRLDLDGTHAAHYWVEDARGVRLMDFHNAPGQAVHVVRPPPNGRVYVRRLDDNSEYSIPVAPMVVSLADLAEAPPRVASRGAAHEAFSLIFNLPFDRGVVDSFVENVDSPDDPPPPTPLSRDTLSLPAPALSHVPTRAIVGYGAVGLGVVGLGLGAAFSVAAIDAARTAGLPNQAAVASHNEQVSGFNTKAAVAYSAGGVAVGAGIATLLLWPSARHVEALATPQGGYVGFSQSF